MTDGRPAGDLRLLYVGPFNSPHVDDMARAMHDRGHVVQAAGEVWGGGLPASSLDQDGIPTTHLAFPSILELRRLLRRFRPDVVHTHWMPFAMLAVAAGARPIVAQAWGSDVYAAGRRHRLETWLALRRSALAITDSADLVGRLRESGPSSLRIEVVNWGVDLAELAPPSAQERAALKIRLGLGPGPVVFSPRGTTEVYNPAAVLDAFAPVRDAVSTAQLVVKHTGTPPGEWAMAPGVHVIGFLERGRFVDYLRAADVTVSVPVSDSSPRSVWEAMAAGSATVLSDLPWVHELIADGRDALVVPPDATSVAGALERMLLDGELRTEIATNARLLVEEHRNRDVELSRLEALYAAVAAGES